LGFEMLDLASLAWVQAFAGPMISGGMTLALLINNAP
jgi:hypothetical protein